MALKAEQLFERGVAHFDKRQYERAAFFLRECVKVAPDHADAFHMYGLVRLRERSPLDAVLALQHARSLGGDRPEFMNNLGIAFAEMGMFQAAEAAYQDSLSKQLAVDPFMGLGSLYGHLNRLEDCEHAYAAAIELQPDLQDAHVKRAVALLGMGRWPEGWKEYAWRWEKTAYPPRARRRFPQWDGNSGDRVVIYQEQGFGDVIMGLRFILDVMRNGNKICLEVSPLMRRLCEENFPDAVKVIPHGAHYPSGKWHSAALLDLPQILGVTVDDLPRPLSYLIGGVPGWFDRVRDPCPRGNLRVGLCWSAGRRPLQPATEETAAAKSVDFRWLKSLLDIEGCTFYSLQVPHEEVDERVVNLMRDVEDFADTASIIEELDLVITVDTSVAHLAGALGKETWNLVRWNGYWPWLLPQPNDTVSLWYPTMMLFRQPALGDWEPVLADVKRQLERKAEVARAA